MIPIPLIVSEWVAPRLFKLVGSGLIAVAGVSACMWRDASIENTGFGKAVAKIEKVTDNAIQLGKGSSAKSGQPVAPGVRPVGQRDPTTRID